MHVFSRDGSTFVGGVVVKKLQRAKQQMFEITQDAEGGIHQRVSIIQRVLMSPISYKLGCWLRANAKIFRFQTSELYHIRNMTEFGLPLRGCSHSAAFVETNVWLCNTYIYGYAMVHLSDLSPLQNVLGTSKNGVLTLTQLSTQISPLKEIF